MKTFDPRVKNEEKFKNVHMCLSKIYKFLSLFYIWVNLDAVLSNLERKSGALIEMYLVR